MERTPALVKDSARLRNSPRGSGSGSGPRVDSRVAITTSASRSTEMLSEGSCWKAKRRSRSAASRLSVSCGWFR